MLGRRTLQSMLYDARWAKRVGEEETRNEEKYRREERKRGDSFYLVI